MDGEKLSSTSLIVKLQYIARFKFTVFKCLDNDMIHMNAYLEKGY